MYTILPATRGRNANLHRQAGWTQWELLAGMGILVLVAIVFAPEIRRGRQRANDRQCLSNLRQIGAATRLYLQDYDEVLPFAWGMPGPPSSANGLTWYDALAPYLKLTQKQRHDAEALLTAPVFHCPTDTTGPHPVSYALNALIAGAGSKADTLYKPEALSAFVNPNLVVWCGDTNKNWSRAKGFYDTYTDWVRPEIDLGYRKEDDRAIAFYRRWLKERDWTGLQADTFDCPDGLYQCKYPSFRHGRAGAKTGLCAFVFVDGHVRACRWGTLNVENLFAHLTPRQADLFNH